MLLKALVLVCSIHPQGAVCTPETAIKAVEGPVVTSLAMCEFQSTVLKAQNQQIPGTVVKTDCVPAQYPPVVVIASIPVSQ